MSLLKIIRTAERNIIPVGESISMFEHSLKNYAVSYDVGDYRDMLMHYGNLSYSFLLMTAKKLEGNSDLRDKMSIMTSFIVEATVEQQLKYYDLSKGYSIIDKVVEYTIANGYQADSAYIQAIIDDVNSPIVEADDSSN